MSPVTLVAGSFTSGFAVVNGCRRFPVCRAVGLVAGPSAAWCHGFLTRAPDTVEIAFPASKRSRPGVRVRERVLAVEDRAVLNGLPVVGPARTVLDTAVALSDGSAFLDRALQRHVSLDQLRAAEARMTGANGVVEARRLLAAAGDRAHSMAERLLLRLLKEAGIGGWVLHLRVGPYEVDVAFPETRVAIEIDGWAWHSDVERFRSDRRKGNDLVAGGWTLLRFTWHDLHHSPQRVVAEIRAAQRRAS